MPQWQWSPEQDPEPEQHKILMPYLGQGTDSEKSACANRGVKTIGNVPVCALSSDAVSAFPSLAALETLSAIVNLKAWTPCTFLCQFFQKNLKIWKKFFFYQNSFVNRALLFRAFLSFARHYQFSTPIEFWLGEREREGDLYTLFPSCSSYHVPIYSSIPKSDLSVSEKKRADYLPGCLKPEVLYCCNQVFQYDTGVSNSPTLPTLSLRTTLNILPRNNKYSAGGERISCKRSVICKDIYIIIYADFYADLVTRSVYSRHPLELFDLGGQPNIILRNQQPVIYSHQCTSFSHHQSSPPFLFGIPFMQVMVSHDIWSYGPFHLKILISFCTEKRVELHIVFSGFF